jgi:hypothetical protein
MVPGYRCGYVKVPESHEWHGKDICDLDVNCHCGLTYAEWYLLGQEDGWWIGFDCAHACDGYDFEKAKEYYADNEAVINQIKYMEDVHYMRDLPVRSLAYCETECMKIVNQMLAQPE